MVKQVVGVKLPCPSCGEREAEISLNMADQTFHCHDCDDDFNREGIENIIRMWPRIFKWIDTMPTNLE